MEQSTEIRNSGIVILLLGIIHFALSEFLDYRWGVVLVVIGIIAFFYQSRKMLVVFGGSLILVGLLNIFSSMVYENIASAWQAFGYLQIILGCGELYNFYKPIAQQPSKPIVKIEGEESILKSVVRLLLGFLLLIIIGVIAHFLTTKTDINPSYVIWPILVGVLFVSIFFIAYNFATEKKTYKIKGWPYEKVVMNEPYLKKLKRERPGIFYPILAIYIFLGLVVCGVLIMIF